MVRMRSSRSWKCGVIGPVRSSSPTWMKRAPELSVLTVAPQRGPSCATSLT